MNNKFILKLKNCIASIFKEIYLEEKENLFEFGILTNQDVSSIILCYNTNDFFANQLKDEFLINKKIVSYNRWLIAEWNKSIGDENLLLNEINDLLYHQIQPKLVLTNPNDFKDYILDLMCKSMVELKQDGIFSIGKKDIILYIEQADSYIDTLMIKRINQLLSRRQYDDFLHDFKYIN